MDRKESKGGKKEMKFMTKYLRKKRSEMKFFLSPRLRGGTVYVDIYGIGNKIRKNNQFKNFCRQLTTQETLQSFFFFFKKSNGLSDI